ncbi:MAG TPA: hypothetical protein VFW53_00935, partial [Gallionella sp.]|nr:hypothetical protein [Gallionella sp.]
MRLNPDQIAAIKQETEHFFGARAQVWLFGSRVDDSLRGGDVDLYVRPEVADPMQRAGWVEQRDTHRLLDGYRHSLNPSYELSPVDTGAAASGRSGAGMMEQRGFTLVELVIT